jgi:hypothetical protein
MHKKMREELDTLHLEPGALSELRRLAAESGDEVPEPMLTIPIDVDLATEAEPNDAPREPMASIPFELVTQTRQPEPPRRLAWALALLALLIAAGVAVAIAATGALDG